MKSTQKPRYGIRCLGWFLFGLFIFYFDYSMRVVIIPSQEGYTYFLGEFLEQSDLMNGLNIVTPLFISVFVVMFSINTIRLIGQDLREEWQKLNH
ncbi:hypothetical protein ACSYAD_30110 [Acaryochloris marina NIES-2412]|uniref:hypothetical protein n=1 Tax=Acaryochloris marina TaxID=155978 RepID=UPI00405983C0